MSEDTSKDIKANEDSRPDDNIEMPPADFTTFLLSMSTTALFNLGEIKNPETGESEKNLTLARHTIDLIDVLKDKTKGNLTDDESKLLADILSSLHLKYINAAADNDK